MSTAVWNGTKTAGKWHTRRGGTRRASTPAARREKERAHCRWCLALYSTTFHFEARTYTEPDFADTEPL